MKYRFIYKRRKITDLYLTGSKIIETIKLLQNYRRKIPSLDIHTFEERSRFIFYNISHSIPCFLFLFHFRRKSFMHYIT
jgi:hypothetical protein